MNSRAWPYPFEEVAWADIAIRFHQMAALHPPFSHMADVVDSVIASSAQPRLAGLTSMHDLVVTTRPVSSEPPIEVVIVRSPSSLVVVETGKVLIEHCSISGHDDRIVRPSTDAVRLFWRFMIEKFAVEPTS
jgi:hypothetical protein